jgi:hypothetical protein
VKRKIFTYVRTFDEWKNELGNNVHPYEVSEDWEHDRSNLLDGLTVAKYYIYLLKTALYHADEKERADAKRMIVEGNWGTMWQKRLIMHGLLPHDDELLEALESVDES